MFVQGLSLVFDCKQRPDTAAQSDDANDCESYRAIQDGAVDGILDLPDRYLWRKSRHLYFVTLSGACRCGRAFVRGVIRSLASRCRAVCSLSAVGFVLLRRPVFRTGLLLTWGSFLLKAAQQRAREKSGDNRKDLHTHRSRRILTLPKNRDFCNG